jgi:hypothetical protein
MAKIEIPSKIRAENFKEDERGVASGIGAIYNQFVDQIYFLVNGGIDFENLNRQLVNVIVTLDNNGNVVNSPVVRYNLRGKVRGTNCINAVCLSDNTLFPTGRPNISFNLNLNTLIITNITGLQANSQYELTLELIA